MNADQLEIFSEIEERHWWFVARRKIIVQMIKEILPADSGATVLDIGCGTGGNLRALKDAYRCWGVDASWRAIELAKKQHAGIEFIHLADESQLEHLASKADLILMTDVLEHVAEDATFFSRIVAAARPQTYLLLTVPADMSLWSKHDETVLHYRRYDEDRFRSIWRQLPIKTKLISHFNSRLYFAIKLARWTARLRGCSLGPGGMDFVLPGPMMNRLLLKIFAGEARRLMQQLRGVKRGFSRGVSLIALLQRQLTFDAAVQ